MTITGTVTLEPMMPLRAVYDAGQMAECDPRQTQDYICRLVNATGTAAISSFENGRLGGWLFAQESFIRAIRAIFAINKSGQVYTYGTDLEERLPTVWQIMADAVETYAKDIHIMSSIRQIDRDINSGWDRPIRADALKSLFSYCLGRATAAFPRDRTLVETYYKTGVFNVQLNTTQSLARIEAGQG